MRKPDKLLNGSAGYGTLTNIVRMRRVWLVEHMEGVGTEESPVRKIHSFFDEEGKLLNRIDPFNR